MCNKTYPPSVAGAPVYSMFAMHYLRNKCECKNKLRVHDGAQVAASRYFISCNGQIAKRAQTFVICLHEKTNTQSTTLCIKKWVKVRPGLRVSFAWNVQQFCAVSKEYFEWVCFYLNKCDMIMNYETLKPYPSSYLTHASSLLSIVMRRWLSKIANIKNIKEQDTREKAG